MATTTSRTRRPELTRRDAEALGWIGEQYGVRFDVLAMLLGRLSSDPRHPLGEPLSRRGVRIQIDRWERSGLARRRSMLGGTWIIPTEQGLRYGGLPYDPWVPRGSRLEHAHAVAMVRLAVGGEWVGERALRRERHELRRQHRDAAPWHAPDGIVADDPAGRLLVEVELTPHHDSEVLSALSRPWQQTAGVIYYTRPELVIQITAQLARLWPKLEERHRKRERRVLPLPEVRGATYEGGW
jgi:hypothetical protein